MKSKELKCAAVLCVGLPDSEGDSVEVKGAFTVFIRPGKMNTGASVTNKTLSCTFVCGELVECPCSERLTIPAVLESLKQFNFEMCAVDEDRCRFFKDVDAKSHASTFSL